MEFDLCESLKCVAVDIKNDQTVENTEGFNIIVERTPDLNSRITLTNVDGVVDIRDDDGN